MPKCLRVAVVLLQRQYAVALEQLLASALFLTASDTYVHVTLT